jgi:hypothetical protein
MLPVGSVGEEGLAGEAPDVGQGLEEHLGLIDPLRGRHDARIRNRAGERNFLGVSRHVRRKRCPPSTIGG